MQQEEDHVVALRKAFPRVWIRADGAFRDEDVGIVWSPGNMEREDSRSPDAGVNTDAFNGLCCFVGANYGRTAPALRLSQLSTLVDYISEVNRRAQRSRRPDKEAGDA